MTAGKQLYHHQAFINIKLNNGNSYTQSLSHASMFELVKVIREHLQNIRSTTPIKFALPADGDVTGTVLTTAGEATIKYRRNLILSKRQWRLLNNIFADKFS